MKKYSYTMEIQYKAHDYEQRVQKIRRNNIVRTVIIYPQKNILD